MNDAPSFFPSTRSEALAYEYVKLHMTEEMTPEELADFFVETYQRIKGKFNAVNPWL